MYDKISDFYEGKSIFLTGSTGFLGSVLLESLLRCLPGIKNIYLLLRFKKGLDPLERKNHIFQKEIFKKLLKNSPQLTEKVKIVMGDLSQTNLGISKEDLLVITQEVSIVIHCGALLSFTLPYRVSMQTNVLGTRSVIDLCRKLKKCEVLVFTSTALSNTQIQNEIIKEKVYKPPFSIETVLTDLDNKTDEWFLTLISENNNKWPNSYVFSKCIAENILVDEVTDFPVIIVRPSIIFGTLKGPCPGYVEKGFGSIEIPLAVGTGFLTVFITGNTKMQVIPVDFVANTIIASSWLMVTQRISSPFFVNCTCGDMWKSDLDSYNKHFQNLFRKNVMPNSLQETSLILFRNWFLYKAFRYYRDLLPSFVLDVVAYFKGRNIRLMPIQKQIDKLIDVLSFFLKTPYYFDITNFKSIAKQLHQEDREIFYTDLTGTKLEDNINNYANSSAFYNWNKDKFSPKKRKHLVFANTMLITLIRRITFFSTIGIFYFILSKLVL